jgi:hypothetical protein
VTTPAVLAHFTLLEPIGAGGMGEVFRARDERLGREVALKRLPTGLSTDALAVERFRREARAASALSHPNIVTIFDVGETDDGWFIAMELVRGTTLAAGRGSPWPVPRAAEVLRQCALALAAAHEAGIVHRDFKPENVMVRDDGYVKLLDFGLARLAPRDRVDPRTTGEHSTLTEPGMFVGTMGYLSPEQACGEAVGPATDVFALGIVAYELLTGTHPFAAPTQVAMLSAILTRDVPPLATRREELPAALDALVTAMLRRDARERPSAQAVADSLRGLGAASAVAAPSAVVVPLASGAWAVHASAAADGAPSRPPTTRLGRRSGVVVGRARDLAGIQAAYAEVCQGRGLLVCVAGEPGIGKTTLVESALAALGDSDEPPVVARGRCSERLAGTEAYLPVLDALEAALDHDAGGPLATLLDRSAPSWAALLGRRDAAAGLASQERLKREMATLLERASRAAPIALFLDDLHWADASTVDLLAYLGARLDRMRVLLLATYRDAELHASQHPFLQVQRDLEARGEARALPVALLSEPEVQDYLDRTYPGHAFPPEFARTVHARTEGSPLFVADLLSWLGTRGVIAEVGGRWALVQAVPEVAHELPGSVRSMIERKITQLDGGDRRVLAAAAVQGAAFDVGTVGAVLGADAADLEEQLLVLDKVYAFVRRIEDRRYPDGSHAVRYRFVHALYQNALAAGVAPSRRAGWSAAAADHLERRHGAQAAELAAELAALRDAARQPEQAAAWYAAAATRAMGVFAYAEAEALATRGLAQVAMLPDGAARVALELPLRLLLGATSLVRRGFAAPETAGNMGRAQALCEAIGGSPALADALWVLILYTIARGDLADATRLCAQLLGIGEASGDPVLLALGHLVHVGLHTHRGDLAAGLAAMARTDAVADDAVIAALRARFHPDPILTARCEQVRLLWLAGRAAEAQPVCEALVRYAAGTGDPQGRTFVGLFAAELAVMRGEPARGERIARDAMALCEEHGIASERAWNTLVLGVALAAQGATADGIARMRGVLERYHAVGSLVTVPFFQGLLARALLDIGDLPAAQAALADGFAVAERTGERMWDALLWRVQGEALALDRALRGDGMAAAEAHERARQAAERSGAVALLAPAWGAVPKTAA